MSRRPPRPHSPAFKAEAGLAAARGETTMAEPDAQFDVPIHFVGVAEKAKDLQPFSAHAFARALAGLDS